MKKEALKLKAKSLFKKPKKPSKKKAWQLTLYGLVCAALILTGTIIGILWGLEIGQTSVWDQIYTTEKQLRDLYSNSTQIELKARLPEGQMNFTDGLVWESQRISYTEDRPKYQNVIQVLNNGKGACGEFVWVFAALCVAKDIPFRVVTVGYFVPNVVDHTWAQVNPSRDGKTWIHVEVTDSCDNLRKGNTTDQLWNWTINNNHYYDNNRYKMVLAYQLSESREIIITDVTSTFSPP